MKILVINGPNLNRLGKREPEIYGHDTYEELVIFVRNSAVEKGIEIDMRQSNIEGEIISWLHEADDDFDGVVINPAAYSHYSIGILDAIKSTRKPVIEVHLSNIHSRETFRKHSVTAEATLGIISGLGFEGYSLALEALRKLDVESISL